jgi:acyl-[acyl-carrier-protein]-phospholipid O-acyltransferase/long-chain-fatty-acid--[acyl-carrier-protein] ligase
MRNLKQEAGSGPAQLMLSRRFAPLFWCQFFSAFSDNFLKNALVLLILFHIGGAAGEALITLAGAVFISPYFFLSALGGQMADRFDKSVVARRLKLAEIGIALVAVIGFGLHSIAVLFVALFLFGTIGALFGPIKYGILPDHLARSELPTGNALVEGATFMAILLGMIVGGLTAGSGDPASLSALMIVFSLLCWGASLYIPPTGEAAPDLVVSWNVVASTRALLAYLWHDEKLRWGSLVTSWFWFVGVIVLALMPPLVVNVLGGTDVVYTIFLAVFSIAVAAGSGLAAWLARGRIVLLPTVIGAALLGIFCIDLGWQNYSTTPLTPGTVHPGMLLSSGRGLRSLLDFAGMAVGGGLFIVPAFAAVQAWAGAAWRARVVAAVNVQNAAFMVCGPVIIALLQKAGVGSPALFLMLGAGNLIVGVMVACSVPANLRADLAVMSRGIIGGGKAR